MSIAVLTERVEFKAALQKGNRVQVPKLLRWKYKLDSAQVLKVAVMVAHALSNWEMFYGRMDSSGRITISKLVLKEMLRRTPSQESFVGAVMIVRLERAEQYSFDEIF